MPHPADRPTADVFIGDSEMAQLMREHDWASTSLGPPEAWPQGLKMALRLLLTSRFEMWLGWGPDLLFFYNDAYRPTLTDKHPRSLGTPTAELWSEIWDEVGPLMRKVVQDGEATWNRAMLLLINRMGGLEETYHTFSYSPLFGDTGKVEGLFCAVTEETERVISERRLKTLRELASALASTEKREQVLAEVTTHLGANQKDLPFTLTYFFDESGSAERVAVTGGPVAQGVAPSAIAAGDVVTWQSAKIFLGAGALTVDMPSSVDQPTGDWDKAPRQAVVVPIASHGSDRPAGMLIAGKNPYRRTDGDFESFVQLLAGQIASSLANADAFAEARAEAQARASESERLNRLFEQAPGFVVTMHGPDHIVDFVNDAHRRLFNSHDWTGRAMRDAFPSIAGQGFIEEMDRVFATGEIYEAEGVEVRFQRHPTMPTETRRLTFIYAPVRDGADRITGVFCQGFDVTDLHNSSNALREEARLLATLNRTGAAIAGELDPQRLVQMVTDAGVELTGAQFGAFFYNVLDEQGATFMLYALSGAERADFENFGKPRPTDVFRPTFEGTGVVRSDDIRRDPRYGQNTPHRGVPSGHLPVASYLAVPVISRSGDVIGGLLFGHPEAARFDERDEHLLMGLAGQAAVAIDNARLYQALQLSNETLEQRVADEMEERARVEEALRQAQKMEAIGQLTGGIAHDFNNLLGGISGSLELLEKRLANGQIDGAQRYIASANDSTRRAASLTQRLLAFSRRQTLDPKAIDANKLIAGMADLIRRSVGPDIAVEVVGTAGVWPTRIDPSQLENALLNLCINARDAMAPNGGTLTIETANRWMDEAAAKQRELTAGQYVSICVSDTGTGMSPDVIARAFDPFYTTKPIGQGTGLGLSMVYGFVRQSGGQVRIYSEIGHGTTICLYLPRYAGEVEAGAIAPAAAEVEPGDGETVLVIDDEPILRMLILDVLSENGYRVIDAVDGVSGLRILDSDQRIDLLVTDVGLPGGMNGRQVADAARARRPGLKVLFITGYAENAALGNGVLGPSMQVLTKPFPVADLANKVRAMLDQDVKA